jgi:hypothetical protein
MQRHNMARLTVVIALALALGGWTTLYGATSGTATVNNGGNMRSEPQVKAGNVIGQVCPGDKVTLLDQRDSWYKVRVDAAPKSCDPKRVAVGAQGWVSASLLTIAAPTSSGATPKPTAKPSPKPTAKPSPKPAPKPTPKPKPTAAPRSGCDPSYPTVCIPPPPPDLDCKDIPYRNFKVLQPDPHHFDGDKDGVGCES